MTSAVRTLMHGCADAVFPRVCPGCGSWDLPIRRPICLACSVAVTQELALESCPRCAATVGPFAVKNGRCPVCRDDKRHVAKTLRGGVYRQTLRRLVRAFKYDGRETVGALLADRVAAKVEEASWRERVEAVTPVPAHWRHRFTRPVHAAELLADRVARQLGICVAPLLRRVRSSRQTGLSMTNRQANVRGAYRTARGVRLYGARLLLVDDVHTTGATLEECARVLRKAGAAEVYAAVVACTERTGNLRLGADPMSRPDSTLRQAH